MSASIRVLWEGFDHIPEVKTLRSTILIDTSLQKTGRLPRAFTAEA